MDKLIAYVKDTGLTSEQILNDETVRWTLTTPLYNIVFDVIPEFKKQLESILFE